MQQMHWTATRGHPAAPTHAGAHPKQPPPLPHHSYYFHNVPTNANLSAVTGGAAVSGATTVPPGGGGVASAYGNPSSSAFYSSRFTQPTGLPLPGRNQQSQYSPRHPLGSTQVSTQAASSKSGAESSGTLALREAPAIAGANSAAAQASPNAAGIFFSGTRTNFTDVGAAAAYGLAAGNATSPNGPNATTGGLVVDANDEKVNQLLRELENSVDSTHTAAVLRDAVDAIDARALANFDPLSRDTFVEQRVRDVLSELSRITNPQSLMLAVNFIEALVPIPYTSPTMKFTRLCRSLTVLLQCGNEKVAREAQRVYKLLLEADARYPGTEQPLKLFVPKEIRENCEQALLQLHGRLQQSKAAFPAHFFSIMLGCAATAEVNPRYIAGPVRVQVIQLGITLAGSPDLVLRNAAHDCLVAIFRSSSNMRPNELVLENRRVCDECLRALNASQHNEGHIVSALKALHALLSSRGLAAIDKQVLPQLCVLVTEQHRVTKSLLVRNTVCDVVPIIAPVDIVSAPRRSTYTAIIMEPVKNVREERFKAHELHNVAAFIRSVGYRILDATNRTNLESILHRYVPRRETQEACWSVMAAICASSVPAASALNSLTSSSTHNVGRLSAHRTPSVGVGSPEPTVGYQTNSSGTATGLVSASTYNTLPSPSQSIAEAEVLFRSPVSSHDNAMSSTAPSQKRTRPGSERDSAPHVATLPHNPQSSGQLDSDANNGVDSDKVYGTPMIAAKAESQRSSCTHSLTTSPTSTKAPPLTPSATSAHNVILSIDDVVQRCLPFLAHAVLTQPLVDSLHVIQSTYPQLKQDVQMALDKLVDNALKEPFAALSTAPPSSASAAWPPVPGNPPPRSLSPRGHDDGDLRHQVAGSSTRRGSVPTPQTGAHPFSAAETTMGASRQGSSVTPMGWLTQYFRPGENAGGQPRDGGAGGAPLSSPTAARPSSGVTPSSTGANLLDNNGAYTVGGVDASGVAPIGASTFHVSPLSDTVSSGFSPTSGGVSGAGSSTAAAAPALVPHNDLIVALKLFTERPVTSAQHLDDLKNLVVVFQRHDEPLVRQQSSNTIISSLQRWISYAKEHKTSTYSTRVTELLEAYMKNALMEVDRQCELVEIALLADATNLRIFLSEQRILSSLLSFLNSTALVREKTIELLVAITQDAKPSTAVVTVQQSLYVAVESCVVVLEFTNEVVLLLRSMADLRTFARLSIRPLSSHLGRIFYAFRKRLLEESIADVVLLSILRTLEVLLRTLGKEEKAVLQYQDNVLELYNPVVETLKESPSPALSHAAISVLVHMNEMCIPSVSPTLGRQQELITALTHVYTSSSCTVKESLSMLTLFGQLGAIGFTEQFTAATTKKKEDVAIQDEADLELTYDYTVIVYRTLSRMIDASLSDAVCSQALRTLLQFIRFTQDKKDLVGGVHAVRAVLQVAKRVTESPALRVEALHVLAAITALRHERIARLMLPEIVVLLEQLWTPTDRPLFRAVLEVVSALKPGKLSGKEQSESWAWLYPRLVDVALQDRTETREFGFRVVEITLNASYIPPHCIPVVFPMLLQFIQQPDQLVEVRSQSLCAAVHIVCELKAVQFLASLLHGIRTLTRHCELNVDLGPRLSSPGVRESLKVLAALHPSGRSTIKMLRDRIGEGEERLTSQSGSVPLHSMGIPVGLGSTFHTLGHGSSIFGTASISGSAGGVSSAAGVGNSVMSSTAIGSGVYGVVPPALGGGSGGPNAIPGAGSSYLRRTSAHETYGSAEEEDIGLHLSAELAGSGTSAGQEIALFMRHVEQGFRLKDNKFREWFAELQKIIIRVSPHPAFRMMVDLLDKHEPLRRELFLPSFKCLYESLSADQMKKLNEMLTIVLNCSDQELSSKCLSLADYLDHNEPQVKPEVLAVVRNMRRTHHRRISRVSENGAFLMRSTTSSVNTAAPPRPHNAVFAVGFKSDASISSDAPSSSQMPAPKKSARQGSGIKRTNSSSTSTTHSGMKRGSTAAPVSSSNSVKGRRSNIAQPNLGPFEFTDFFPDDVHDVVIADKPQTIVSLTSDVPALDAADHCSDSPADTLDEVVSEYTVDGVAVANANQPLTDPSGVAGVPAMGSYRPLVYSVIHHPMTNDLPLQGSTNPVHPNSNSSSHSNELSTESRDLELQSSTAHIPAQSNVLFSTEDIVCAAERTRMYDKALSYLENRFLAMLKIYRYSKMPRDVIHKTVWPLAWLYSQRENQDAVVGLFRSIRYEGGEDQTGFGYELLCSWSKAQKAYAKSITQQTLLNMTVPPHILEGYVRTLALCGEWKRTYDVVMQVSARPEVYLSSTLARCGATAAWILGQWDNVQQLAERLSVSERHTIAHRLFFLNGVALRNAIKENSSTAYDHLRRMITKSKLMIDESLRTLLPLSYMHAYENLTMLQHFTEMEEMIDYCNCHSETGCQQMYERWNSRFHLLKPDTLTPSLRSLMLHSLVLNTGEMADMILHFCETRQASHPQLTEWAMNWLRQGSVSGSSSTSTTPNAPSPVSFCPLEGIPVATLRTIDKNPRVAVGFISHLWSRGKRRAAVESMELFLEDCGNELKEKHAACYGDAQLRLGTWKQELYADSFWKRGYREEELGHFHKAIRAVPESYEAWHSWGLMNYRIQQRDHLLSAEDQCKFVEAAHQGFVGAICRCTDSSEALPAVMRLLQLWVIHDGAGLLKEMVADSILRIPIDHWVQTIPQLIGHLSNDNHDIREVISMILRSLCEVHPQATVFPLLVVMMSDSSVNGTMMASGAGSGNDQATVAKTAPVAGNPVPPLTVGAASGLPPQPSSQASENSNPRARKQGIVQGIIRHCPKRIFHEAEAIARLLVDVSAIPIEKIRESLSQVAAAWNPNAEYEEDPDEVYSCLQNALEIFQANRRHLLFTVGDIGQFVQMVMHDDQSGQREKAAGVVSQLLEEISKHVAEKLGREPQKAMEPLLHLRNLSVAVFGEYDGQCRDNYPTIASFSSKLDVIPSKKRPRRIQLNGSDGCLYTYCLKGNEDIRMDERVMQLFGMVNVLLSHTRVSSSAYIHRFPVIPISSNVGLLGWVENSNTINNTICNYRATISHLRTHQESSTLRAYVESFGNWDKLSIIQRTEVLDFVMNSEHCEAVDVSRAMWHRANTAEQWLDRRNAFTVSLATMSMVGYVLGLGDRHLGNILISMSSGKVVHIDFGDSFDVGRLRHVLPETVPFRLTRMLTNAMEVFGVDGVFRASSTRTQTTLHANRDSIMALLSSFVYDPIVQYKGKMKNIMEKSRSPQDVAERIRNKLRGMEMAIDRDKVNMFNTTEDSCRRPDLLYMSTSFDDAAVRRQSLAMTPEEQVSFLIDEATRTDNYTTLYFGWGPLW